MTRRITSVWTLAGVLLLAGMAACSGSDDAAGDVEARDGFAEYSDEQVTFAVPDNFERTPPGEELISGVEVEYLNDPSGSQPLPEQITLRYAIPDDPDFLIVAWPPMAIGPVVGDDELTDRSDVEVAGAREALRVEYRLHYDQLDEPARLVALGAIIDGPDGPVIADLRYVAVESEFDEQVVDAVLESLRART